MMKKIYQGIFVIFCLVATSLGVYEFFRIFFNGDIGYALSTLIGAVCVGYLMILGEQKKEKEVVENAERLRKMKERWNKTDSE